MRQSPLACLIVATMFASPLTAQVPDDADSVSRIRLNPVSRSSKRLEGRAVSIDADTVRLVLRGSTDTVTVATVTLRGIEEFRGRRSNLGRGALIGAMTLGIAGAIITPFVVDAIGEGPATNQMESIGVGLAGGAVAGAIVGGLIGAMTHRDRWSERPTLNLRAAPTENGIDLGLAMRIGF